jgi:hypothetical protein
MALASVCAATAAPAQAAVSTAQWQAWYSSGADYVLWGIAAFSRTSIWAVGAPANYSYHSLVIHWDGQRWRTVTIPGVSGYYTYAVAGSAATDVWVFGDDKAGKAEAFRWDGAHWHTIVLPAGITGIGRPAVISATSAWIDMSPSCQGWTGNSAWKCTTRLYHWNGRTWRKTSIGEFVSGVAASPSGMVLAVGNVPHGNSGSGPVSAFQWTGSQWRGVSMPHPLGAYAPQIAMDSASDAWISSEKTTKVLDYVLHWDGHRWTEINTSGGVAELNGSPPVAPDGQGGVWLGDWAHYTRGKWVDTSHFAAGLPEVNSTEVTPVPGMPGSYLQSAYLGMPEAFHPGVLVYGPIP